MAVDSYTSNSKKHFAKTVLYAIGVVLAFIIIDQAFGYTFRFLINQYGLDNETRINIAAEKKADIIVLGASKAETGYNPAILEAKTGLKTYNLGISAVNPKYTYAVLNLLLAKYKPKVILYELSGFDFYDLELFDSNLSLLHPYWGMSRSVDDILRAHTKMIDFKMLFQSYRYNNMLLPILTSQAEKHDPKKGFLPLYGSSIDEQIHECYQQTGGLPANRYFSAPIKPALGKQKSVGYLIDLVKLTKQQKIKLIFICSPCYHVEEYLKDWYSYSGFGGLFADFSKKNNIPLISIDTINHPEFDNPKLFKDLVHLNLEGASKFSSIIGDSIKHYYSVNPTSK